MGRGGGGWSVHDIVIMDFIILGVTLVLDQSRKLLNNQRPLRYEFTCVEVRLYALDCCT